MFLGRLEAQNEQCSICDILIGAQRPDNLSQTCKRILVENFGLSKC